MKRFDRRAIVQYLQEIDLSLEAPETLVIIGGAAMTVGWELEKATTDIDTFENVPASV